MAAKPLLIEQGARLDAPELEERVATAGMDLGMARRERERPVVGRHRRLGVAHGRGCRRHAALRPAGVFVDEEAGEEQHQARRTRLDGDFQSDPQVGPCSAAKMPR
jgi:hypothetical protein